jgi:hypothetical protein
VHGQLPHRQYKNARLVLERFLVVVLEQQFLVTMEAHRDTTKSIHRRPTSKPKLSLIPVYYRSPPTFVTFNLR